MSRWETWRTWRTTILAGVRRSQSSLKSSIEEETSQKKPKKYLTDSASENVVLGIEREIVPLARGVALSRTFPVRFELSLISSPLRPVWSRLRGRQTGVL